MLDNLTPTNPKFYNLTGFKGYLIELDEYFAI